MLYYTRISISEMISYFPSNHVFNTLSIASEAFEFDASPLLQMFEQLQYGVADPDHTFQITDYTRFPLEIRKVQVCIMNLLVTANCSCFLNSICVQIAISN